MKNLMLLLALLPVIGYGADEPKTVKAVYSAVYHRTFPLGLAAHKKSKPDPIYGLEAPTEQIPAHFDYGDLAVPSPILDQGQCGSCVYHSVVANIQDSYILAGDPQPPLTPQYPMDCGRGDSCNGSVFEWVAGDWQRLGGNPGREAYPYQAQNQRCQKVSKLFAPIISYHVIDSKPRSIMAELLQKHPVSVTVGAGSGSFMDYRGGVYGANGQRCVRANTDHEVLIQGYDCGKAVTTDGKYCVFRSDGTIDPKAGAYWKIRNSWSAKWGEKGYVRILMTDSRGYRCNGVADEAGVVKVAAIGAR